MAQEGTLDQDRLAKPVFDAALFQPLGKLRANPDAAAQVLALVTELDVAKVDEIEVEWTPEGQGLLGDKTAFDAFVSYRTVAGRRGFFAVETKYTESFSRKIYDKPRYREVTAWPIRVSEQGLRRCSEASRPINSGATPFSHSPSAVRSNLTKAMSCWSRFKMTLTLTGP